MRRLAAIALLAVTACTATTQDFKDTSEIAVRTIGSLDPALGSGISGGDALAGHQIFEGLVTYDPETLKPRPALASSWSVDASARRYIFRIRPGVKFHDGRALTSSDAAYSLNRLARAPCAPPESPLSAAPGALLSSVVGFQPAGGECAANDLEGINVKDSHTLEITVSRPTAELPSILTNPAASIIPAGSNAIGTGPYRVTQPWDGSALTLESFDQYWGERPTIRQLRFIGYPDDSVAYVDLLARKIDYASIPAGRAREAKRAFGERGFVPTAGIYMFGFNLRSRRVTSLAFREALNLAARRETTSQAVYEGTREAAGGLVSPLLSGTNGCETCTHDPEGARERIKRVYPSGPPEIVVGVSDEGSNPAAGRALVADFARVGVVARLAVRSVVDHLAGIKSGDVDLYQFGWIPAYPSAEAILSPLFSTGATDNLSGYSNAAVDALLAGARGELDPKLRTKKLKAVEDAISKDLPALPLLWYRSSIAAGAALQAKKLVDGFGLTRFADLHFDS